MKRFLITLHLLPNENNIQFVKQLPGLREIEIDEDYGLILISPKRNLYVIHVSGDIDPDKLMSISHKVKGVYVDVKVFPISHQEKKEE
ncbi:MAG: hypothetical protein K8R25_04530 [Methanosarcinales archaeon]|nr:hypothetical protein [Methanosarcinales archaeon]